MFELLGIFVFVIFLLPVLALGMAACGALAGVGTLFDAVGGVIGAVFGLIGFVLIVAGLVVASVMLGFFTVVF